MITSVDDTLRELLVREGRLSVSDVDYSFELPNNDWSAPITRPTINLYLYDIRENTGLREMKWSRRSEKGEVRQKRGPLRMDLSYMITCWSVRPEDQHRLLWLVLDTLMRNSPIPREYLKNRLRESKHPVTLRVAQPDGILANLSDYWGSLGNQLRPSVNVVATVELDLGVQIGPIPEVRRLEPVFRQLETNAVDEKEVESIPRPPSQGPIRPAESCSPSTSRPKPRPGPSEPLRITLGGFVRDAEGRHKPRAEVRLLGVDRHGNARQYGDAVFTDSEGRYRIQVPRAGRFSLVVELAGGEGRVEHPIVVNPDPSQEKTGRISELDIQLV